jgi:protein-tyrosine phosphatase
MKAFWWFKENSVAGMGRPGFNSVHWFDMPFDEAVALGWIGQQASGSVPLESFRKHIGTYAPKIFKFYNLDEKSGMEALRVFNDEKEFAAVIERLAKRVGILQEVKLADDQLHFGISEARLQEEIKFLKERGINHLVTLTESHHSKEILKDHFTLHHIGIEDLGAPTLEQARELADVMKTSIKAKEKMVVHCLAGIGRTSTMIVAAHVLMGERFEDLQTRLSKQNPWFTLTGPQGEFLRSMAAQKASELS